MTLDLDDLRDLRCHTCGRLLALTKYETRLTTWCHECCADTPVSGTRINQSRDEIIIALFMEGRTPNQIADELGLTRQNVQQILIGRGADPFYMTPKQAVS